jgi:hypothetical protein
MMARWTVQINGERATPFNVSNRQCQDCTELYDRLRSANT